MNHTSRKTLVVIGAGPKGIAVAVKAKVLEEMGLPVDKVVLIEKHSVGAHWSGEAGYTDGEMRLGTSPEKDVVFPMESALGDPSLDSRIRQRLMAFTWASYLVESQQYSDWVDRGKPAPKHVEWASYLKWVSRQLSPQVSILKAQVKSIDITSNGDQWHLKLCSDQGVQSSSLLADRLMLTGPGKTRLSFGKEFLPAGTYDLESFWRAFKNDSFVGHGKIAIVGAGENAASVLLALTKLKHAPVIEVISPKGFISTRAENYHENQYYSQPLKKGWDKLQLSDRIDFIRRTDIGVFSVEAMQVLNNEVNHKIVPGRLTHLEESDQGLILTLDYDGKQTVKRYDQIIFATGFDLSSSLKSFFTAKTILKLEHMLSSPLSNEGLSGKIQEDLSVEGITPSLHLPMLAGLKQGPGFSNLSCLGLLSDRVVLTPIMKKALQNEVMEA